MNMERRRRGRRRIEMMRMENSTNLQVTFSKRRAGIFKKASELCTLCGAEVLVIVFSPGGKPYSFGHPCVETVTDHFLSLNPQHQNDNATEMVEPERDVNISQLNMLLAQVTSELEKEQERGKALRRRQKEGQMQYWWEKPVEKLSVSQLSELMEALEPLRRDIAVETNRIRNQDEQQYNFCGASSSHSFGDGGFLDGVFVNSMLSQEPYNPDDGNGGIH